MGHRQQEEKDFEAAAEMKEENRDAEDKVKESKDISSENEEEQLKDSINFILNMEDPNYKTPEPCISLTCPLTGEQYYVDWKKTQLRTRKKENTVAYPKKNYIFIPYTLILYIHFNTFTLHLYQYT